MQDIVFRKQNAKGLFGISDANYDFVLEKPMICPHCGSYEDGIRNGCNIYNGFDGCSLAVVCLKCSACSLGYLIFYKVSHRDKKADFGGFFPAITPSFYSEALNNVSPRFIELYNQALRAENVGDIDLAAAGYRNALECLIKDYAINELKVPRDSVVKKSLHESIGEYLDERALAGSADVVRILGNDYTHYERKYSELDFSILKKYMGVFTLLIEAKYDGANPPVSR